MNWHPIKWWRFRQLVRNSDRRFLEHLAETDIRDNRRLADSYSKYPMRLVAIVIADIFMDTDIRRLWRALELRLAPDKGLRTDRNRVREFLRRAESKAGGSREGLGEIYFYPPGESKKYIGGGQEVAMPAGVDGVVLLLYQFAPGMVMAATVAAARPDMAEAVFASHHTTPVKKDRGGISFQMVETAKARQLENEIRAIGDIGLLPKDSGLLADRRFPSGTLVAWSASTYPSDADRAYRDVTQVLGIATFGGWWEGAGRRLYPGVPNSAGRYFGNGGYSLVLVGPVSDSDQKEAGSREASHRYNLTDELDDWLPAILLMEAALVLVDKAGVVRERLSRRAVSTLGWLWSFGFSALVSELSDLQYRLERLRQAIRLDDDHHAFSQFPVMNHRSSLPAGIRRTEHQSIRYQITQWLRNFTTDPKPQPPPYNLRQSVLDGLNRYTREGLHEVRLSIERARLLAEIRSTNVLLTLTAVLIVLTLILVVRGTH